MHVIKAWLVLSIVTSFMGICLRFYMVDKPRTPITHGSAVVGLVGGMCSIALCFWTLTLLATVPE